MLFGKVFVSAGDRLIDEFCQGPLSQSPSLRPIPLIADLMHCHIQVWIRMSFFPHPPIHILYLQTRQSQMQNISCQLCSAHICLAKSMIDWLNTDTIPGNGCAGRAGDYCIFFPYPVWLSLLHLISNQSNCGNCKDNKAKTTLLLLFIFFPVSVLLFFFSLFACSFICQFARRTPKHPDTHTPQDDTQDDILPGLDKWTQYFVPSRVGL